MTEVKTKWVTPPPWVTLRTKCETLGVCQSKEKVFCINCPRLKQRNAKKK